MKVLTLTDAQYEAVRHAVAAAIAGGSGGDFTDRDIDELEHLPAATEARGARLTKRDRKAIAELHSLLSPAGIQKTSFGRMWSAIAIRFGEPSIVPLDQSLPACADRLDKCYRVFYETWCAPLFASLLGESGEPQQ